MLWLCLRIEYRASVLCTLGARIENLDGGHISGMRLTEARLISTDEAWGGGLEQRMLFSHSDGASSLLMSPRLSKSAHELNPISTALYHDVRLAFGPAGTDYWKGYRL